MVRRTSLLRKLVVLGVGLLVVSGGALGYAAMTFQQHPPTVESVTSEWGDVTREQTEVSTTVVVRNPNDIGIPGVAGITYSTKLNDVVIMEGSKSSVGLSPGRNEITIPATMENRAIAEWWVSHVNDGETSTMAVQATLEGPGGVSEPVTSQSSMFETNMLEAMQTDEPTAVTLQGEEFIVLKEQSASWGEATMEETPIHFSATVENSHDYPLTLDGLGYVIRMNDVTVGSGQTAEGVAVAPGDTGTIAVDAAIVTERMADWWASHVRNEESTRMTVEMYGLVERDGELVRVPVELFEKDLQFETDMLGGGGTSVQPVQGGGEEPSYQQPTVVETSQEWGTVTAETTDIRTTVTVDNPNEGTTNEFVSVGLGQRMSVNGVTVADGSSDFGTLDSGTTELQTTVAMDNSKVPEWWARHVNGGERSTLVVEPRTTADLGFTKFAADVGGQERTVETDVLAGLNDDESQEIRSNGRTVATVEQTRASWGGADDQQAPIEVDVTIENTAPVPLTLGDLEYTIEMNDVTVGDGTAPESHTIYPGETKTVTYTITIDSQQMDEWWVSHIKNGEETSVGVDASVEVSGGGSSDRVELDGLTDTQTLSTDFLGGDGE